MIRGRSNNSAGGFAGSGVTSWVGTALSGSGGVSRPQAVKAGNDSNSIIANIAGNFIGDDLLFDTHAFHVGLGVRLGLFAGVNKIADGAEVRDLGVGQQLLGLD